MFWQLRAARAACAVLCMTILAMVFSLKHFNQYTFRRHVNVESDNKPLETILQKPLVWAPWQLHSKMMRLQKYDCTVHYERGTNIHLADTLSRAYFPFPGKEEDDIKSVNMVQYLPIPDKRLNEIRMETRRDQSLRSLSKTILVGWPDDKKHAPPLTHRYFSMWDELTVQDRLIFKGNAVVILRNLCTATKAKVHSSHLGIEACLRQAQNVFTGQPCPQKSRNISQHAKYTENLIQPHKPRRSWCPMRSHPVLGKRLQQTSSLLMAKIT